MSSLRVCRLCFMCFFSAFHWKSHKVIIFLAVLWQSCLEILPQSDTKAFRQQRAWICYPSATELLKSVANHSLGSSGGPQSIRNLERGDHISKAGFDVAKWGVCLCFCSSWCWKHPPGFRQCRNDNTVWGVKQVRGNPVDLFGAPPGWSGWWSLSAPLCQFTNVKSTSSWYSCDPGTITRCHPCSQPVDPSMPNIIILTFFLF